MSDLKSVRKRTGMTQIQLAARANISRFRISLAETGNIELRPDEIAAINDVVRQELENNARVVSELTGAVSVTF